eukprot:GFUD01045053.1.p1 GENE.GFUD01045053.1~~GFUD01045053.1.p1  ORF type:complete len:266 (+),score=42.95 GFUD01045053.1:32-829(+)
MNSETFSLTWNDFSTCTQETFRTLLNEDEFMDVTLVSDDQKQVKAHKVILSACSPFFKAILKNNPHPTPLIFLSGVDMTNLKAILDFIYLGETAIDQDYLDSFMLACKLLKVKGLTEPDRLRKTNSDRFNERPSQQSLPFPIVKSEIFHDFQEDHPQNITNLDPDPPKSYDSHFQSPIAGSTFSCTQCDYKSNSRTTMKRHDEMKHQGIRYPCDECDFKASTKDNLKRHNLAKHEGATFSCDECEFKANQKGNIRRHKLRVHFMD